MAENSPFAEAWQAVSDAGYTVRLEPPLSDREVACVTLSRRNPEFAGQDDVDEYLLVLSWGAPSIEEAILYAAEVVGHSEAR